jgi:hypothetical protein
MDKPRVFEEGTVTLVIGSQGCSVYVGANELQMFSEIELKLGEGNSLPLLKLQFQRSHDEKVALKLDEERRMAQSLSWANVCR